jgi:hypothetical protein
MTDPDHHSLNFITGNGSFMRHFAFQLNDWGHLQKACDVLAQRWKRKYAAMTWGPSPTADFLHNQSKTAH